MKQRILLAANSTDRVQKEESWESSPGTYIGGSCIMRDRGSHIPLVCQPEGAAESLTFGSPSCDGLDFVHIVTERFERRPVHANRGRTGTMRVILEWSWSRDSGEPSEGARFRNQRRVKNGGASRHDDNGPIADQPHGDEGAEVDGPEVPDNNLCVCNGRVNQDPDEGHRRSSIRGEHKACAGCGVGVTSSSERATSETNNTKQHKKSK